MHEGGDDLIARLRSFGWRTMDEAADALTATLADLDKMREGFLTASAQAIAALARAKAAEAREVRLREALRMYAFPEHWMPLTDVDSQRVVWVARTHFDATPDGYSTAAQVLMSLVPSLSDTAKAPERAHDALARADAAEARVAELGAEVGKLGAMFTEQSNRQKAGRMAAEAREKRLLDALAQCAEWFRQYGLGHEQKGDGDKAKRNFDRAFFAATALSDTAQAPEEAPDGGS